jgi:hypothetical protein
MLLLHIADRHQTVLCDDHCRVFSSFNGDQGRCIIMASCRYVLVTASDGASGPVLGRSSLS